MIRGSLLMFLIVLLAYLIPVQSQQARNLAQRTAVHSQGNAANEFYIGFMQNYVKPVFRSVPSLLINKGTMLITTAEPAGALILIESEQGNSTHMIGSGDTVRTSVSDFKAQLSTDRSKGIRIKAEQSKTVLLYALNEELHSVEGFTALPCTRYPSLSMYTYFAISVPRSSIVASTTADSAFLIVACSDNTVLDITCTQNIQHPTQSAGEILADKSFQITLNERETLYIQSRHDLSGSKVESTAPVSFYSGHECGNVPRNASECDHLVEQLPPTATWGRQFLLAPTATRKAYDVIKVIASENDTLVAVSCTNLNNVSDVFNISLASAGKFSDFILSFNQYCSVSSDNPILVVQFTTGKGLDNTEKGDPFMVMVPAVSQYLENTTFSTVSGLGLFFDNYINVFSPAGRNAFDSSSVILDGMPLTTKTWVSIPCSDGSVCGHAVQVAISNGVHSIWNTDPGSPIGVTVYGMSFLESYAYFAALKLTLSDAPTITPPAQTSYIVLIGRSLCLPCNVHPFHYAAIVEWQKDGVVLAENSRWLITNNGALCISNTTQNDGGNYTCHVAETSVSYQLSVVAGIIVELPSCGPTVSSRMALAGVGLDTKYVDSSTTALQICCNVEGPANSTTITWLQGNNTIKSGRKYEIGDGYMRHTGPFRDGCITYTCRASFESHTIQESSEVCIGNIRPPTVVSIAGDMAVVEHTSTSYHCSANGFPIPQKMWTAQRDSEEALPPGAVDHGNGTLTISNITEKDGKLQYCCDTSNSQGRLSNCIMINVLVPPEIVRTIQTERRIVPAGLPGRSNSISIVTGANIMVPETSTLTIICEIDRGNPNPSISWLHNNVPVSDPRYTVQNDGSLRIDGVLRGRDDGVFTCIATTAGLAQDSVDTVVAVSVLPRINSTDIVGNPGNCLDLTQQAHVQQQVGSALCLRAGPNTSLSLYCNALEGLPEPSIHWMKDGQNLSEALNGYQYYSFSNGLLVINNLTLPIEASQRGQKSLEGTYTCVATNVIGVGTGYSYVALFGNISVETVKTEFVRQSSDLYRQFHESVSEHFSGVESGDEHLIFFTSGRLLPYREFDYGYRYDGSEETVLPQTMENIFDLVDIIPDAGSIVFDLQEANRLRDTYSTLVNSLQVTPSTLSLDEQRKIRQYLLEVVPDPGSDESLPRLSLYLLYKNSYYMTKIEIENTIDAQRQRLPGWEFNKWYERNIHTLQMKASSVYMQWEMYAGKRDMEDKLGQLNLEDHAEEISDALALLLTNERKSRFKDEKKYSLVRLYPDTWYKTLENRVYESIHQMQFQLARLKTEIRVLEITSRYLDEKTRKREVLNALFPSDDPIYKLYCGLSDATYQLEELVKDSEDMRYNCIATGNPSECQFYWTLYEYISTDIIANYTEFYWYVHTVEAALNHREFSIPAIAGTIASIETRVENIQSSINIALSESADRDNEENEDERDFLTNFNFVPTKTTAYNFQLPQSVTERLFWYINPESTRLLPKQTVQEYNATFNHLNTAITNISAKIMKVNIHRRWLKPGIFGNKFLSLKAPGVLVSPGKIHPPSDFRTMVSNGSYQLPLYPSTLILATDIQLFLEVPFVFHTLPTLVKLSYDPHVTGGIGPFSFGPLFHASTGRIKFKVSVRESRIVVTIPGTQLVGFVCDVVPQHPREQVQQRKRRSPHAPENSKDTYGMESQFDDWLLSKKNREPSLGQVFHKPGASGEKVSLRPAGQRDDDHTDGLLESLATLITPTLPLNSAQSELDVSFYSNLSLSSTGATTSASVGWKGDTKKSQGG